MAQNCNIQEIELGFYHCEEHFFSRAIPQIEEDTRTASAEHISPSCLAEMECLPSKPPYISSVSIVFRFNALLNCSASLRSCGRYGQRRLLHTKFSLFCTLNARGRWRWGKCCCLIRSLRLLQFRGPLISPLITIIRPECLQLSAVSWPLNFFFNQRTVRL